MSEVRFGVRIAGAAGFATLVVLACLQVDPAAGADPAGKSKIVFVNGSRIFSIDADGTNRRPLTFASKSLGQYDEENDRAPRVSPDGKSFLFLRDVDYDEGGEITKLMVASMEGSKARTVTSSKRLESRKRLGPQFWFKSGAWDQGGARIIFSQDESLMWLHRTKWVSRVRSIKPNGSGLKTILTARSKRTRKRGYRRHAGLFADIDASPVDGRLLVTKDKLKGQGSSLLVVNPESGKAKRVIRSAKEGRWSPDGSSILFLSDRDKTGEQCEESSCEFQSKLYTARFDGSSQRRVQRGHQSGTIVGADWSPDGARIAFGSDRNFPAFLGIGTEIYSIEPGGACLTWLTNGSPGSWDPNWSPVTGTDSDPGTCGANEREALVDPLPSPHPTVGGKRTDWPRLWPGPVWHGKLLTWPTPDGEDLAYFDCGSFQPDDCRFEYADLGSRGTCDGGVNYYLDAGRYRGMIRRRGALVTRPLSNGDGTREVTLVTGGQTITIQVEDAHFRKPTHFSESLDLVDDLRPVGRDDLAGADLQEAVFDRGDIKRATGMKRSFKRTKSIPRVASRFNTKRKVVRAYLRFQKDLDALAPVNATNCH